MGTFGQPNPPPMRTLALPLVLLLLCASCERMMDGTNKAADARPLLDSIAWDYGDPEVERAAQEMCSCITEGMRSSGDRKMVDELIKDLDSMVGLNRDEQQAIASTLELKYQRMGFDPDNLANSSTPNCQEQLEKDYKHLASTLPGKRKLYLIKKTLELKCVLTRAMFAGGV